MAKIKLNNNEYPIPDSKLAPITADFITHLGKIAGNGMKVVVGGVEYGIDSSKVAGAISEIEAVLAGTGEERLEGDGAEFYTLAPTALSFRSTAPLNELQEIQIDGVTVDSSNYTLEEGSTIVTFHIDYLKTLNVGSYEVAVASDSKTVKGGFTVKAPELNEHGFYYNQPYTAYVEAFGGNTAVFIRNNGTLDLIVTDTGYIETCNYTIANNQLTITAAMGTFTASFTDNGNSAFVNELYTTFVLGDTSITADEDYIYIYKEDLGGYEVNAIDKTKAEYGAIKTGINGVDTVKLIDNMFDGNNNLIDAPEIPSGVTIIGDRTFRNCISLANVEIPDSVTSIGNAFIGCTNLSKINIPNSVTSIKDSAFENCINLTSVTFGENSRLTNINNSVFRNTGLTNVVIPNSVTSIDSQAFCDCKELASIIFNGTTSQWNAITKGGNWNYNVPATYVQCSDGQVTL